MQPFTTLTAVAAPLPMRNVDTDMIIPKQFLKTIERTGLGKSLFHELRYDESGNEVPDFVLNRAPYRAARILVTGENFGCGSSREHAPWALADYGFRAIVAPSFADIFFGNCCQNGLLPVVLPETLVQELFRRAGQSADGYELTVDLAAQQVRDAAGFDVEFPIDPYRKQMLLEGLDEIGRTLLEEPRIAAFERRRVW